MNKKTTAGAFALLAALLVAGCASSSKIFFAFEPKTIVLAGAKESDGQALVLGQAYMEGYGNWTQYIVTSVDGTRLYAVRTPINLYVPAGNRTLTVTVAFGNAYAGENTISEPRIVAQLQPGQVYQVKGQRGTDVKGKKVVDVGLIHLGTIEQYNAYLARYPKQLPGIELMRRDLAGL